MTNSIKTALVTSFYSTQRCICDACDGVFDRCSTDAKIYTLLILGRLIQSVSIATLALSAYGVIYLGPISLVGIIPSLISGLFGTYIAESCDQVNGESWDQINDMTLITRSFVLGQPIGLKNPGNDCWLNSALQILQNVPAFQKRMRLIPEFQQFCEQYEKAEHNKDIVSPDFDSNALRLFLNDKTNKKVSLASQEDAAEVFEYLFQGDNALFRFKQRVDGQDSIHEGRPLQVCESMIQIGLGQEKVQPDPSPESALLALQELFNHYFDHLTDYGLRRQLFLDEASDDLLIQFKIFYFQGDSHGKIVAPLEISPRLTLKNEFVQTGIGAQYECDAFIKHSGAGLNSGHYIAYVKKAEKWWYCSDAVVYEISEEAMLKELPYAYICHYAKIASNMPFKAQENESEVSNL